LPIATRRNNFGEKPGSEVVILKNIFLLFLLIISTNSLFAQIEWIEGRYFPHFAKPDTVYVFPVICPIGQGGGSWECDWRINQSSDIMHALTLSAMQGIINRSKPRVFLSWRDPTGHFRDDISGLWAELIKDHVKVINVDGLDNIGIIDFLWQRFGHLFTGAVIYDPNVPDLINLATMVAALEDRIILAPEQIGLQGIPDLQNVNDLRTLAQQQGWDDSFESQLEIYQWVYDNLWPSLERRIIATESPGPRTSGDKETTDMCFPVGIASRDYLVALKLPVLYLNPKYADHEALFGKFLAEAPSPIPVTGVVAYNEAGVVRLSSSYGDVVTGNTWPGEPLSSGNLTVLSGVRPEIKRIESQIKNENILATLGDKPVATLFISDGDNLCFQTDRGFHGFFIWEEVQGQNFGWETNPLLSELAPIIWNYYQDSNSEVSFTSAISGAGYVDPYLMNQEQFSAYLEKGAPYLKETGLRVVRFNGMSGPWNATYAAEYYNKLKEGGYLGTIIGFQPESPYGISLQYLGTPVPAMKPTYWIKPSNKDDIVDDLISRDPDETFIKFKTDGHITEIRNVVDNSAVGGKAMLISTGFFNSPSYCLAFSAGPMTLPPGNYVVKCRLKAADNSSSGNIATIYVGERFAYPDWRTLKARQIRASDFDEVDRYQEFEYQFELDDLTQDIEFRLDYGDGSTDLYADYIRVTNDNPLSLPVFAPLYMSLAVDLSEHGGMKTLAGEFVESFEARGGIVLTPDEFFAALNPEFMIEFGSTLLGANDPNIIQAKAQLSNGEYLASLLTVRDALLAFSSVEEERSNPEEFILYQSYPNPFNLRTTIPFHLPKSGKVTVRIYDLLGREIRTLAKKAFPAGFNSISWDGRNNLDQIVGGGLYFYQIETQGVRKVGKALLIK
jgi:hypothetical protein